MPFSRNDLMILYSLSSEEVEQSLSAAQLAVEQETYSDEEIQSGFDVVRSYFNNGQANDYATAAELFKQHLLALEKSINISSLLALVSVRCGTRISLKEVGQILDCCGLADKDQYTSDESDRFLEACELIKQQGKSYEEVAAYFGIEKAEPLQQPQQLQQLLEEMGELTMLNESVVVDLVDKITEKRTEALKGRVQQSYLKNASLRFQQDKANASMFVAELEQRVLDYMEGKRPAQSLQVTWDWEKNSLPSSSPKPMSLPEGSDNGTSDF